MPEKILSITQPKKPTKAGDQWLRRQALMVVAQLPEEPAEALTVLKLAECLVQSFLIVPGE